MEVTIEAPGAAVMDTVADVTGDGVSFDGQVGKSAWAFFAIRAITTQRDSACLGSKEGFETPRTLPSWHGRPTVLQWVLPRAAEPG
jgi:hypothetical protein